MMRIAALNEESVSVTTKEARTTVVTTREAQEEAAFALYNEALLLQKNGKSSEAELTFLELLRTNALLSDANDADQDDENQAGGGGGGGSGGTSTRLGAQLKYSAYKNLASLASKRGDNETAMEFYLEACSLDSSDVSVWFHVGSIAIKIVNYPLASLAFRESLKCSPSHWPSLDNLVTILYTLNDYSGCLYYIAQALQMDSLYAKGLAIRDQIFREHPGLRRDTMHLFYDCDSRIYDSSAYDEVEGRRYVDEALEMRRLKRQKCAPPPPVTLNFAKPLTDKSWRNLGDCLADLYELISKSSKPRLSFGCLVNVGKYVGCAGESVVVDGMDVVVAGAGASVEVLNEAPGDDVKMEVDVAPVDPVPNGTSGDVVQKPETVVTETDENQSCETGGALVADSKTSSADSRKGRKRKSFPFELVDASAKRRSARVRDTATKGQQEQKKVPAEKIDFAELLRKFLPSSLLSSEVEEPVVVAVDSGAAAKCEGEASTSNSAEAAKEEEPKSEPPSLVTDDVTVAEEDETNVVKFLESVVKNTGVLDIMYKYLLTVGERWRSRWPPGLSETFAEVYSKVRDHITHPSLFGQDREREDILWEGVVTLCNCEFRVDRWLQSKIAAAANAVAADGGQFARVPSPLVALGSDFPGRHFGVDVDYLMQLTTRPDIFGDAHLEFHLRALWLKARFLMLQGRTEYAVDCLEQCLELLVAEERRVKAPVKLLLVNCKSDNEISQEHLQKQLESLQQCQSLEDMHRLYQSGEYQQVADLLAPTLHDRNHGGRKIASQAVPDRQSQLLLLLDSLLHVGVAQQTLYWGELALNEAWQRYRASSSGDCTQLIVELLDKLESCVSADPTAVHTLPAVALKRLIQNLIGVVVVQMETPESTSEMPINTLVPWMLLYHIIGQEEAKIRALMLRSVTPTIRQQQETCESSEDEEEQQRRASVSTPGGPFGEQEFGPGLPSSLMLLFSAHEYLGRRGWCTASGGAFLLLYAEVAVEELRKSTRNSPHPFKEYLEASAEQCFFCLYGHPNRKAKAKRLKDHNVAQVPLTWSRSVPLFEYFKPKEIPEFDSVKALSVSTELEFLLKRILALVPAEEAPSSRVDVLSSYIDGSRSGVSFPQLDTAEGEGGDGAVKTTAPRHPITSELYYLLGDFYFKNYEQSKAIKFYLLDVAVVPDRFDSWAGMALARSSQLEQKLNSISEFRNETAIYRRAASALRCFNRALVLQPTATALWIENGTLAYVLHSYSSRQLRQREQYELSDEAASFLQRKGHEMLRAARVCFKSASVCEDIGEEEWLHHYMLGKAAEKKQRSPKVFLHHYKLAALYLHVEGASYPRRIQYHNPPTYSLEALEVYFRTHASVLKFLIEHEGRPLDADTRKVIEAYLKDAADGAFANFQEKRHSSNTGSDAEDSQLLLEECRKLRRVNPINDHDYFKRKRKNSGPDDHGPNAPMRNRPSIDSSSESQDSAAIKDILNAIVSVITEQMEEGKTSSGPDPSIGAIVVGDTKIVRPPSQLDDSSTEELPPCRMTLDDPVDFADPAIKLADESDKTSAEATTKSKSETKTKSSSTDTVNTGASTADESPGLDHRQLIRRCENALLQCLSRFPQHYKSLYRLAHYYFTSKYHKDTQKSWDYLMGPSGTWQNCSHMTSQALFAERKNTNFFNGIWRIPIDEIDRTGSFSTHMFRSVVMLMDIITELGDHNLMMHLTTQLHRNPDTGKKYLRDNDRLHLAKTTFEQSVSLVMGKMTKLCPEENPVPANQASSGQLMVDVNRAWLNMQKVIGEQEFVSEFVEKVYTCMMRGKVDGPLSVLEQVAKFCQQQQLISKSSQVFTPTTPTTAESAVPPSKPVAEPKTDDCQPIEAPVAASPRDVISSPGGDLSNEVRGSSCTNTVVAKPSTSSPTSTLPKHPPTSYSVLSSPSRLTADVQSKIKSLDPVEPMGYFSQKMSGFQLEFLRQIGADRMPTPAAKEVPKQPSASSNRAKFDKNYYKPISNAETTSSTARGEPKSDGYS